jgi:hypothetical protein
MLVFDNFEQLDNPDFFGTLVKEQFEQGWQRVAKAAGSKVKTDAELIKLAFDQYGVNIKNYTVALNSQNPDQYKRAGAFLHALYRTAPIVKVDWPPEVVRLSDNSAVGVSYGDAEYWNNFTNYYDEYCNYIMSFDLAFRCCDVYEEGSIKYDKDFLDNMCYYMAENNNLNVGSFVMIFKAYFRSHS